MPRSSATKALNIIVNIDARNMAALKTVARDVHTATVAIDRQTNATTRKKVATQQLKNQLSALQIEERSLAGESQNLSKRFMGIEQGLRRMTRWVWMVVMVWMTLQNVMQQGERVWQSVLSNVSKIENLLIRVTKSAITTAGSMEMLRARASAVFSNMTDYVMNFATNIAMRLPFDIEKIMQALILLRASGVSDVLGLGNAFSVASNLAIVFGKDVTHAATAVKQYYAGYSASLTRTYGIRPDQIAQFGGNVKPGGSGVDASSPRKRMENLVALANLVQTRWGTATMQLASTLQQLLTNVVDLWLRFSLAVSQSGILVYIRALIALFQDLAMSFLNSKELRVILDSIATSVKSVVITAGGALTTLPGALSEIGGMIAYVAQSVANILTGPVSKQLFDLWSRGLGAVQEILVKLFSGAGTGASLVEKYIRRFLDLVPAMLRGWGAMLGAVGDLDIMLASIMDKFYHIVSWMEMARGGFRVMVESFKPGLSKKERGENILDIIQSTDSRVRGLQSVAEGKRLRGEVKREVGDLLMESADTIEGMKWVDLPGPELHGAGRRGVEYDYQGYAWGRAPWSQYRPRQSRDYINQFAQNYWNPSFGTGGASQEQLYGLMQGTGAVGPDTGVTERTPYGALTSARQQAINLNINFYGPVADYDTVAGFVQGAVQQGMQNLQGGAALAGM